jgi:hypothetical protein
MDTGHVRSGAALEGRPANRHNRGDKSSGGRRRGCRACPHLRRHFGSAARPPGPFRFCSRATCGSRSASWRRAGGTSSRVQRRGTWNSFLRSRRFQTFHTSQPRSAYRDFNILPSVPCELPADRGAGAQGGQQERGKADSSPDSRKSLHTSACAFAASRVPRRQLVAAATMMRTIRTAILTKPTTEAAVAVFILVIPHPLSPWRDCFPRFSS